MHVRALLALAAVVAGLALAGCGADARAELVEAHGTVERDFAASVGQWQRADVGAQLERGDGLRTGPKSTAVLRVGRNGIARVASDTTLRLFLSGDVHGQSAPGIEVESGDAVLEAEAAPLTIQTPSGRAILRAGSRVQLTRDERGVRYQVVIGGAEFQQSDGKSTALAAGQSIVVGIGMAVLETSTPVATASRSAAAPDPRAADAGVASDAAPDPVRSVQAIVSGPVGRRARGQDRMIELDPGTVLLDAGDELHVRERGRAELVRGDERATLGAGHYEIGRPGAPLVRASDGKLRVTAERTAVTISVPGGTIVAQVVPGGSRADLVVRGEDGTTEVEVLAGRVSTTGPDGETQLAAGEQATLAAAPSRAQAAREAAGGAQSQRAPRAGAPRTAEHAELIVPAGETFRVYDPAPPTAIGFNLGKRCPGGAEVRVEDSDPQRGKRQVNVLVGPGLHRYTVHCLYGGQPARRAAVVAGVRVVRSDGTRRPATAAARNDVDLDGRNYTLMYQNLRPILEVRWPDAKRASSYVLHVRRPDGSVKQLRAAKPRAVVQSGMLADGVHTLRFEAAGGASSKETRINIVFDNAAPAASLKQPAPAGFAPGDTATLSGVAVEGSTASIGDRRVALDAHGRFSIDVPLKPGQRALAIRFRHAKHGIRYYLRRAAGGDR